MVSTLHHRAKAVCSTQQLLEEEEKHLQKVLTENKYPTWALNRVKNKIKAPTKQELKRRDHANNTKGQNKPYMILPYVRGLSESMKNICKKHGVQVHYRGGNTIKGLLMAPKDKDHITMKSGIIYRIKCQRVDCDDESIGESSRIFGGLGNILKPLPQYMTTRTSQVMIPPLITSILWGGRTKTSSEPSKRLFTSGEQSIPQ